MLSIYKASAGSGKTFTLAYEYIKLLLGYKVEGTETYRLYKKTANRHRSILAITFTNKATDEMKRRIIHELAVIAGMEPGWMKESPYAEKLTDLFKCTRDELKLAAENALRGVLFDFNFFNISTIDSFFQLILRTFAREAELTGNYELDLRSDYAVAYGVNELFQSLSTHHDAPDTRRTVKWITDYLLSKMEKGDSTSLFNRSTRPHKEFVSLIDGLNNETLSMHHAEMTRYLAEPTRIERFLAHVNDRRKLIIADIQSRCAYAVTVIEAHESGSAKINARFKKMLIDRISSGKVAEPGKMITQAAADPTAYYSKAMQAYAETHPMPELEAAISDACKAVIDGYNEMITIIEIRQNIFVLGVLAKIFGFIEQFRAENNTLLLSDTNTLLRSIIGEDDTPFIYERLGLRLHHFLIDEFQDTSRMQWDNLSPMVSESVANASDSLIIGDEKQCIYRFRNSDPSLLQHRIEGQFSGQTKISGNSEKDNTNWRSSADVVAFNNELFTALALECGCSDVYANVTQRISPAHAHHSGYVEVTAVEADNVAEYGECALCRMAEHIKRQLASGYKPSDIAILTRRSSEGTQAIDYLMRLMADDSDFPKFRIISDDALRVDSAPSVRLIVSVLKMIATPQATSPETDTGVRQRKTRRHLMNMLNAYEFMVSRGAATHDALKAAIDNPVEFAGDVSELTSMECFNLTSLVERIINRYLSPGMHHDENMYISAFQDVVAEFSSLGINDIHSFIVWWEEKGHLSKVSAPQDENALRVMTIHKSKGLEFQCVHLPFMSHKLVDFMSHEWFDGNALASTFADIDPDIIPPLIPLLPKEALLLTPWAEQYGQRYSEQLLDELNILYVAFTRAVTELIVSYPKPKSAAMVTAGQYLDAAIHASGLAASIDENGVLRRGVPSTHKAEERKLITAIEPFYAEDMPVYYTNDRNDLWANINIDQTRPLDFSFSRDRGIVLHNVLRNVRNVADLPNAVAEAVKAGYIPTVAYADILEGLEAELQRDEVKGWFDGFRRVLCERPLTDAAGNHMRTDRIVWTAQGTVDVVDYKFGEEHTKRYSRKVREYVAALEAMGFKNVRGFLWYLDSGKIVKI